MNDYEGILCRVRRPSRYLGTEVNSLRKNWGDTDFRMVLAFPDVYEVGTSHFGIQILYDVLNADAGVLAERVYAPDSDMEDELRSRGLPLFSLESRRPLGDFDVLGFSLLYELNYTNVLNMLDLAGIPLLSRDRDDSHPVVIAGGPCACNPEPVSGFFDAIVVGDGEPVAPELVRVYREWKTTGGGRRDLLRAWSRIRGVYIPSFFTQGLEGCLDPVYSDYTGVRKAVLSDLDSVAFCEAPIVPYSNPVHDRLRIEVARGCSRGCRFCQAGMIYRPVRERNADNLAALLKRSVSNTGYEELSLLSLSTGDYSQIDPFLATVMAESASDHVAVSFPSMRAGTLSAGLMEEIKKVRKTGFTIAPEAGSQRLRDVINKNITEEQIFSTVEDARAMGWRLVKLYFMTGLPTETHEDLEELAGLVARLKKSMGRRLSINVSVGSFVPKPHTPFQWAAQQTREQAGDKIHLLKRKLGTPGVKLKWQDPSTSVIEGVFSRGGRELVPVLVTAFNKGCRFDGWTDCFDYEKWKAALGEHGLSVEDYVGRKYDKDGPLPWDHVDMGVTREFLIGEWDRALAGETVPDCRTHGCHDCGACDFQKVEPRDSTKMEKPEAKTVTIREEDPGNCHRLRVVYSKTGPARFFGHLEFVSALHRALRRAGVPMLYSQGYHPLPKVSFTEALPLGMESEQEEFTVTVPGHVRPADVFTALQKQLPEGVRVLEVVKTSRKAPEQGTRLDSYVVQLPDGVSGEPALSGFMATDSHEVSVRTKKGREKVLDVRRMVRDVTPMDKGMYRLVLERQPGKSLKPLEVLAHALGVEPADLLEARVLKLAKKETPTSRES
ncbi:MAG: TIGR03960 family B12-binding radical SAM protein [Desulfatibacillaceae bacterium]